MCFVDSDSVQRCNRISEVVGCVCDDIKGEIFGLVYLEAMTLGCITIAARHEGIDGIFEDGVNGFLCEAGNAVELATIINKIRQMSPETLMRMPMKAKQTSAMYSDVNVAQRYIKELEKIVI